MSSLLPAISWLSLINLVYLAVIVLAALLINRLLRLWTKSLIQPASSQARAAQTREQQTRMVADLLYGVLSKLVWALAILMILEVFGVPVLPVVVVAAFFALALGIGAHTIIRDAISGCSILLEDQYAVGDTIQIADTLGRVEHLTLRRTVLRDLRGALVTIPNGDIRTVGNLSRDWSQAFVDVAVSPEVPQDRAIQALDAAATALRNDPAWSQALVDGPRILGLQSYDQNVSTIRMQVRTAPSRHEDVARELRRRIQLEFQHQGIALSNVQRVELVNVPKSSNSPVPST